MGAKKKNEEVYIDPVFRYFGRRVFTNEYIEKLRKENVERKKAGKRLYNLLPQKGFQENVLLSDADIKIIGGKRGGGKTFIGLYEALSYADNPDVNMYGFRKYEDDIARGIWKSSKQVYRYFGDPSPSSFEWKFFGGNGATMKMEHLQDPKKVSDRFRGVEMAYILIEELAEHTRDNLDTLFDLLASNRTTAGVKSKCVCTCNPVGRSNKLRYFIDYYIDPETDTAIPERDGKVRYFYRFGEDVTEIAWGDSPEEVYNNINAKERISKMVEETGLSYGNFITSLVFISGEYQDNEILQVSDPTYMGRITAKGSDSTINDVLGIWRDVDTGTGMLTVDDMCAFFNNSECTDDETMRASADVALTGDFFTIFAFKGHHICDIDAWRGVPTNEIISFVKNFLKKNGIREENFTYDSNGLGLWLKDEFKTSVGFNNKSASSDSRLWNNLKSESAEKFVKAIKAGQFSISSQVLERSFTDSKNRKFNVKDRLIEERKAIKRKDTANGRFEIISKPQMKIEIGHSPDFIEGLFMIMPLFQHGRKCVRIGFNRI
ncbi:MAG: terminase family protein [Prevotella sp.]